MPGYKLIKIYPKGAFLEKGGLYPELVLWDDIASSPEFWKALGLMRSWDETTVENYFADYVKLKFHNMDTTEYLQNI